MPTKTAISTQPTARRGLRHSALSQTEVQTANPKPFAKDRFSWIPPKLLKSNGKSMEGNWEEKVFPVRSPANLLNLLDFDTGKMSFVVPRFLSIQPGQHQLQP